ncbi:MAG: hypothetical protein IJ234_03275 [Clostridia bacterium]|nr:hypothetical protein [Clostridia bacterium]
MSEWTKNAAFDQLANEWKALETQRNAAIAKAKRLRAILPLGLIAAIAVDLAARKLLHSNIALRAAAVVCAVALIAICLWRGKKYEAQIEALRAQMDEIADQMDGANRPYMPKRGAQR